MFGSQGKQASASRAMAGLIIIVLAWPCLATADGGMLPPYLREIYESEQIAFVTHDPETGSEDLHIQPRFHGDTREFAWIVPVPNLPTVSESDPQLFRDCAGLTTPIHRSREGAWDCTRERVDYLDADLPGVEIISEQDVGVYETMVIGADDPTALADSLLEWGFLHAGNIESAGPVLQSYVDRSWYFVTMRVDSTAFEEWISQPGTDYWYGTLHPIHLSFSSAEIVYPMRISSISAHSQSRVFLYVAAGERMHFAGAETMYANRLSAGELEAIRSRYPVLGMHLQEDDFLTKLSRIMGPEDMSDDLELVVADSDDEFRLVHYSGLPVASGLLLSMLALLAVRPWRDRLARALASKRSTIASGGRSRPSNDR